MKQLRLLLMLLFFGTGFGARAQQSVWTSVLPVSDLNGAMAVATGPDGNAYLTGRFTGSMPLGGTVLSSTRPGPCLFIAKLSPAGQVLRVTKLEGATGVLPRAIAVDEDGNAYVTGQFQGTLTYNGGQQTTGRLTESGGDNIMLVKCGANGTVRWVQQADGNQGTPYGNSYGAAVAVDKQGNSYISGRANGPDIRFGALSYGARRNQGFLASYNRQGQLRWAKVLAALPPGFGISPAGGVAVDNAGHCYLSGYSVRGWTLDGISVLCPGTATGNNLYLARFDTRQGQLLWGQALPADGNAEALAVDKQGDVYVGGIFSGTVPFGPVVLTSSGDVDGFVARLDPDGSVDWATALGGPNYDAVNSLAVDQKSRKVFVSGMMNFTPAGTNQAFISTLNANGRVQGTELVGGPGTSSSGSLALDGDKNVYSTGIFTGSCHFGALARNSTASQAYLARYGSRQHSRNAGNDDNDDFRMLALNLFPNPAQNQLTLRLTDQAGAGQATLYNHLGRPVASRTIQPTAADVSFDTTALPDGLYVLRVAAQGKTTTQMVTVQH